MKVCILGGGLAGLAIGNLLKRDFIILEKNNECGGLCRSIYKDGFTFDIGGSHIIFSRDDEVLKYMTSLLGKNKNRLKRNAKILYKGKIIKYPFENGLSELSKEDNFECLFYFIKALIDDKKNFNNFKEWMYNTFGKGITEKYILPYNEKIWKHPIDEMDTRWIEGRVPQPPIEDIIKSSLGIRTEGYKHQLYFYYPKVGGIESLIRCLQNPIKNNILKDVKIQSIKKTKNKWIIEYNNKKEVFDKVISTIPIQEVAKLLKIPRSITNAINNLKYNSIISVMIGINKKHINKYSWLYIPSKSDGRFHRISFPSNFSKENSKKGKSSILVEISCNYKDKIWNLNSNTLIKETIDELDTLGIISKDKVCFKDIYYNKYAYVIFDKDYNKNISIISNYFEKIGIKLCGRFSKFKYLNMDDTIKDAMEVYKVL